MRMVLGVIGAPFPALDVDEGDEGSHSVGRSIIRGRRVDHNRKILSRVIEVTEGRKSLPLRRVVSARAAPGVPGACAGLPPRTP